MAIFINQCIITNNSFDCVLVQRASEPEPPRLLTNTSQMLSERCSRLSGASRLHCRDAPSTMLFSCRLKIIAASAQTHLFVLCPTPRRRVATTQRVSAAVSRASRELPAAVDDPRPDARPAARRTQSVSLPLPADLRRGGREASRHQVTAVSRRSPSAPQLLALREGSSLRHGVGSGSELCL